MKQVIRLNTFETNSSSMHTLILVSKDDFEAFKKGDLLLSTHTFSLQPLEWFIENDENFKEDYGVEYENACDELRQQIIHEFKDNYIDCDYAVGYTYCGADICSENVYDKDGNEQVAMSIYIGEC